MKKSGVLAIAGCLIVFCTASHAQSSRALLGYGGMLVVPCAELAPDGVVSMGLSRIPRLYAEFKPWQRSVIFAGVTFLPWLEGVMALVRPDHFQAGSGDRTAAVKFLLFKQGKRLPALAVGGQDFFATEPLSIEDKRAQHFANLYWVVSKKIKWFNHGLAGFHLGRGFGRLDAEERQLTGWFGGVEWSYKNRLLCGVEHDGRSCNVSLRYIYKSIGLMIGVWDFSHVCGNWVYSFRLADL